ncbi:MAG: ABC transporter permease [Cyclobacteriaceae bacterium]|nr:ABC transporter permease [Cyclobacteriaceae bacterium]
MLKNYIKIAIRSLMKNSVYSFINIAGLAVGIACSILILLWVNDETSYDKFQPKYNRLYQVWTNAYFDGKINSWISVPQPLKNALQEEISDIKNATISEWGGTHLLTVGDMKLNKRGYFVSSEFLEMFEFPLLKGSAETVLDEPYSIVLTESAAKNLFGDEDPINKIIRLDSDADVKVTGVMKDIPTNSSFEFDYLVPFSLMLATQEWAKNAENNWGNSSFQVFVELPEGTSKAQVDQKIKSILMEKGDDDDDSFKKELFLHPMKDWRLRSTFENGVATGGMIDYVNLFSIIAVFILIIACINFMNLATARSEKRAREVGIRKSVGSKRQELIFQFLGESLLIAFISFVLALILVEGTLPFYNDLVEKQLYIPYLTPQFWVFALVIISVTGLLSGSYPALYLSSFSAVKVLKGKIQVGKSASIPRQVLVVLQFGFSIILIVGTIVIYYQIQHVKSRDLGYNQENLISVQYNDELRENYDIIKKELLRTGVVEAVTRSNSPITEIWSNNFLGWPGKPEDLRVIFSTVATEYDYTKTMGIKMLMGRDFSEDFKSDSSAIIINKAGLDLMNLENPIGTKLDLWGGERELIGVVDNTLMGSPFRAVSPLFMVFDPEWISSVSIRLSRTNDLKGSISKVEEVFKKLNPAYPFEYDFADVEFSKKFTTIDLIGKLANLFAFLALLITGLGLFGLAAFTAEQRTKEIGIRKVLGASVITVVVMISRDFTKLVLVAFVIAAPIAWHFLDSFLDRYPIRIAIPWWTFPLAGCLALIMAVGIVSLQAYKAAIDNPVKSLRSE